MGRNVQDHNLAKRPSIRVAPTAGQKRFECLTYKPARSQPDYMKVICIDGKLEPQQRRPAAKKTPKKPTVYSKLIFQTVLPLLFWNADANPRALLKITGGSWKEF